MARNFGDHISALTWFHVPPWVLHRVLSTFLFPGWFSESLNPFLYQKKDPTPCLHQVDQATTLHPSPLKHHPVLGLFLCFVTLATVFWVPTGFQSLVKNLDLMSRLQTLGTWLWPNILDSPLTLAWTWIPGYWFCMLTSALVLTTC